MSSSVNRFRRKNAAGSRTDKGWDHGIAVDGSSRKVKCKYCQKTFTGGIFRFKHHLACTHSNVEACVSVPGDVRKEFSERVSRTARSSKRKQKILEDDEECDSCEISLSKNKKVGLREAIMSPENFSMSSNNETPTKLMRKRDLREEACQQIARFFYSCGIPFDCVKNPEFVKMLELIGRYGLGLKPPSYHEIRETYLKKEVARMKNLLGECRAEWKKTGCSILCDGWSNEKKRSIVKFFVSSPKGTVFISSVDTSSIPKTAGGIFKMLDDVVGYIGEENVVQVVTDSTANYKAAGELLMEKRKNLYWTPCAVHCIDLILEDLEKRLAIHGETISKAKKITSYIYGRTILSSMVRHFTKERDLVRPAAIRSTTTYLTLVSLNEHRGALISMFTSNEWKCSQYATTTAGKRVQQYVLDDEFWKNLIVCLKAANPLIKVFQLVDSDEEPPMGFIYDAMDQAKQKIRDNFGNEKKIYEPIWNIIDERWEFQKNRPLHAAAYYLNPRFHYSPDFKVDADMKIGLYKCLERVIPDCDEQLKIDSQFENFNEAKGLLGIDMAISARDYKSPDRWWDSFGDECRQLQKFAIRILSLTCNSFGYKKNWRAFEMLHAKKRNRLHQKKLNDMVFVMCNLKLQDKSTRKDNDPTSFEDLESDDEWITEDCDEDEVDDLDNVEYSAANLLALRCQ